MHETLQPQDSIYTIVDIVKKVRSTEGLAFCMAFETREKCEEALKRLQDGVSVLSRRNEIPLVMCNDVNYNMHGNQKY